MVRSFKHTKIEGNICKQHLQGKYQCLPHTARTKAKLEKDFMFVTILHIEHKSSTDLFMLTEEIYCSYTHSLISPRQPCKWILQLTTWLCILYSFLPSIL